MKKSLLSLILATTSLGLMSCGNLSSDGSGTTTTSTYTLSGSLNLSSRMVGDLTTHPQIDIMSTVGALAPTQCGDNYYYQVYCVSFTETPQTVTGNVQCSGNTGSFTVSGLPLNAGVGCFIRRGATVDTNTFSTLGSLEIPAASLAGSTSTIVGTGDIKMDVTVDDSGTITAVVANDSPTQPSTGTSVAIDDTAFSGIYKLSCQSSSANTDFNPVLCKCMMDEDNAYPDKDTCIAANAAAVTNTGFHVDLSLYEGNVTSDFQVFDPQGNSKTIPSGSKIYGISVWRAPSATSSDRTGGEGFPTTGFGANIDFTGAVRDPKAAVGWTNAGTMSANGISVDLTGAAAQVATAISTGTNAGWRAYATWLYNQSTGFSCSWAMSGDPTTDANCMSEFLHEVRRGQEDGSAVLPIVELERQCGISGCDSDLANSRIFVDGLEFNYNHQTWSGDQSAASVDPTRGMGPRPSGRHAFEQFEPAPNGGGGFVQHEHNGRFYQCDDAPGQPVQSALCDQMFNWLECQTSEQLSIRFVPKTTAGEYTVQFENRTALVRAVLGKSNNVKIDDTDPTNGSAVKTLCADKVGAQEGKFLMNAVKQ